MCGSSNPHPHDMCFKPGFFKTYTNIGRKQQEQEQRKRASNLGVAIISCTKALLVSLLLLVFAACFIIIASKMFMFMQLPNSCRFFLSSASQVALAPPQQTDKAVYQDLPDLPKLDHDMISTNKTKSANGQTKIR